MIEYNKKYDDLLKEWVEKFPRSYFKKIKASSNADILQYIENCTPLLSDEKYLISTKVFWVINKLQDFPRCKICGNQLTQNIKVTEGYPLHCSAQCLSDDPEVQKNKILSYEKRFGKGIHNPFQSKEIISKIDTTNLRKYGVKRYTQTSEFKSFISTNSPTISEHRRETYLKNQSFLESKPECIAYNLLKRKYPDLICQYSSNLYPFRCDFYSPENDLYIEYNGNWTHGGHLFSESNPLDLETVERWRNIGSSSKKKKSYYDNAIYTWTDLDVRKQKCVDENGLNRIVFWNLDEVYNHVIPNYSDISKVETLLIPYSRKVLSREFEFYKTSDAKVLCPYISTRNEIVKYFQQDQFFRNERVIWNTNPEKRCKLIENRIKYLKKNINELTHTDILYGFKRSGIYYGFSHFNPLWFRWFINHYNIKTCYDPTGGWGHRLLGALPLERYIYNDFSPSVKRGVDDIIKFFHIKNTITHCEDARVFVPNEEFEAIFTCPPYYNVEEYECGKFTSFDEFQKLIDGIFKIFIDRQSCRLMGIVMREDLLHNHSDYSEKYELNPSVDSDYMNGFKKSNKEFLFVYRK